MKILLNSPNRNRSWTPQQLADGAALAALINAGDEAGLKREKFGQDSTGQWFKAGKLIPSPVGSAMPGMGVTPYAITTA